MTSETAGGRTISYAWDAAGDRTGITWPDASPNALTATYGFDVLRRVTTISANGTQIAAYGYDSPLLSSGLQILAGDPRSAASVVIEGVSRAIPTPGLRTTVAKNIAGFVVEQLLPDHCK